MIHTHRLYQDEQASEDAADQAPEIDLPFPAVDPTKVAIQHEFAHDCPWISCRFDPTGKYLFAGCQDNSIRRIDLETQAIVGLESHDSWVRGLAFNDDGSQLISGGYDGRLIWWDATADAPTPLRRLDAHQGWLRGIEKSPDGTFLATVGDDKQIAIWNIESGEQVKSLTGHEKNIYSVLFHPDGVHLFSGDLAGVVKQWDLDQETVVREFDGSQLHTYNGGQRVDFGGVRSLSVSPDQQRLACSGLHNASNPLGSVHEPLVQVFDLESGELVKSHVADGVKGGIWRAFFHPNGFLMGASSGTSGGFVFFWNNEDDKDFHRFKYPHVCKDLAIHPNREQIATPHFDNKIRVSSLVEIPS